MVERKQNISLMNTSDISYKVEKNEDTLQYINAISYKPPQIDWFMKNIKSSKSTTHLKECIINVSALAVSDGSFFPLTNTGSCAWIIATPDGQKWIHSGGILSGEEK